MNDQLLERRKKVVPNAIGVFNPATAVMAKGAIVTDISGRQLIDFAGGIGVLNAGHSPKPVVDAIKKQAETLIHTCFNVAMYEKYIELAEKLAEIFPHGENGTKVMITNSGAEAVENAIKIARQATGKSGILCYTGAFHGRSMMAMTLTAKTGNKLGCGPFAPSASAIGRSRQKNASGSAVIPVEGQSALDRQRNDRRLKNRHAIGHAGHRRLRAGVARTNPKQLGETAEKFLVDRHSPTAVDQRHGGIARQSTEVGQRIQSKLLRT